ncbi:hypothetical protein [Nocardia sp. CDC160]|uniref:hypothetical protein n=1 Tax=Nocardia sp. CDC160 TaxID=3112166 RepID=UPI002DB57565|nr:hypothetical protein [Nocardia sp. CDC160]MEC3920298.1 hypothetical protein [Nocardia sp. CDC160]
MIEALNRTGLRLTYHDFGPGPDRDMCFGLAEPCGDDELVVGWSEREGWSWVSWARPQRAEPTGYGWFNLPRMAVPDLVAGAVCDRLGLAPVEVAAVWTQPSTYDPTSTAVEEALAAYRSHPAWTSDHQ